MRQIYSLIFRSTDLQIGQTERANLLNKSINGRRRLIKHFSGEDDETRKINPGGEDWKENSEIPGKTSEVIS